MAPALKCLANYITPCLFIQGVNCTRHYPYLNEEVLHPVHRPVDGVVVALVGDVVLASRPCWLHITREGLFWGLLLLRFGLTSNPSLPSLPSNLCLVDATSFKIMVPIQEFYSYFEFNPGN